MWKPQTCKLIELLSFLGKKHVLLIMKAIAEDHDSFSKIEREIPSLNPRILSQRLTELQQHGFIIKKVTSDIWPVKIRYKLTKRGKSFGKQLKKLCQWIEEEWKE